MTKKIQSNWIKDLKNFSDSGCNYYTPLFGCDSFFDVKEVILHFKKLEKLDREAALLYILTKMPPADEVTVYDKKTKLYISWP